LGVNIKCIQIGYQWPMFRHIKAIQRANEESLHTFIDSRKESYYFLARQAEWGL
jgi:hypothetical protein